MLREMLIAVTVKQRWRRGSLADARRRRTSASPLNYPGNVLTEERHRLTSTRASEHPAALRTRNRST
jgi:hypothetical protein